jgi:DNA-binding SARP family transcriptional activator
MGQGPPDEPLAALRAYVSRLRTVLPPHAPAERLRYRAPGYAIAVGDGELDAVQFERLVSEARERAGAGERARAVELYDTALALWRGEVLAEFDPADIDPDAEIARLADLRLTATEQRAEALVDLGRGHEAVTELEALVHRLPERERPAALLMRALYGSGRQADALTVYRDLRRRLVEQLGVEPSEPTQIVHRRLLAHDPALRPARTRPPTNLPRRGTTFVGRAHEIARVAEAVRAAPLVTLTGVGGVGKSRLALEVAERDRSRFPDGVWLCELAPLADGAAVSQAVAAALGVRQRHGLTIEQTVIEYLRDRNLLLVLDNCEHVLDAASRLLGQVVSHCPGAVVLATSREALGIRGGAGLAGAAAVRCGLDHAVRGAGARDPAGLPPRRRGRGIGHRDLPPARRPAARDRAGRGADAGDERGRRGSPPRRRAAARPRIA